MRFKLFLLLSFFSCFIHKGWTIPQYTPWGKDCDMAHVKEHEAPLKDIAGFDTLVDFHKTVISHADGPRSHFVPSSSEYMRKACHKYGFFKGFPMGLDRLIRENSEVWVYPLYYTKDGDWLKRDPVP